MACPPAKSVPYIHEAAHGSTLGSFRPHSYPFFFSLSLSDTNNSRDDKRYMEKKNRAERAKLKKEDVARLRKLVDTAFALDPRMAAFKEQERESKDARKKERQEQAIKVKQEAEREAALAKELQEEKESEERIKREEERKEKEAKKKAIRKEKKNIKTMIKVKKSWITN